jgi:lysosomal acid lipase/cholesteryl ester hydrolase
MICNKENRSLPFLLANQGFDVWLGNNRGNKYSNKHVSLDPAKNASYWEFSFHEMGLYDLPAEINYILGVTNTSQLIYIGHSQGTSQMFAGSSMLPAYFASKIKVFIAMGPATNLANAYGGLLKIAADFYVDDFVASIGITNLFNDSATSQQQSALICESIHVYCEGTEDLLLAHSTEDDDQNAYIVSEGHEPSGVSVRSMHHYAQLIRTKSFESLSGLKYDLTNIDFPVSLHVGKDDNLATTTDNQQLRDLLQNNTNLHFYREYDKVAHSTFLLGKEGQTLFLDDIVAVANQFKQ